MKRIAIILVALMGLTASVFAQTNIIKMTASPSAVKVKAGEMFSVKVDAKVNKLYYTYSFKLQEGPDGIGPTQSVAEVASKDLAAISGKIKYAPTHTKHDLGFNMDIEYYKGSFWVEIPLKAKKDLDFSNDKLKLQFIYQFCDSVSCLPPDYYNVTVGSKVYTSTFDFTNVTEITEDTTTAQASANNLTTEKIEPAKEQDQFSTKSQSEIETKKKEGVFSFIWFAMTAGALALLTPCVFPMVPITVSFFTKRAEKEHAKGRAFRDSSVYAMGIILTFTALGFILALIFGATGIRDFASNGWVNMFIAAIFILFAFNLFGAFEITLPNGLLNMLNTKSNKSSGIMSVFLMSLTFSLTSFTCTVPFVGSALISASGGEWFYPIIGMLAFSAVFAAPFFLLALFPSFLKKMPKAGVWMNNVKVVMGFLEIAFAMKFVSNADLVWAMGILPKDLFIAIWIGIVFLLTLYILGIFRFPHDTEVESVSSGRAIFAMFFAGIGFYLMIGLFGKPLGELDAFLPPAEYSELMAAANGVQTSGISQPATTQSNSENIVWLDNLDKAKEIAAKENKSIFVDFTGFTCTNCRWMEQNFFKKPEVIDALSKMVTVRLYTDRLSEPYLSNKKYQESKFGSIELPLYVILKSDGNAVATETFTRDFNKFYNFVKKGL
jgi:thiol:disulfide interchange protein DsbD